MQNMNQYCHRLEQVLEDLNLVEEFIRNRIAQGQFEFSKNGSEGCQALLEHAAYLIKIQAERRSEIFAR